MELKKWWDNKYVNPYTNRKIKSNSVVFKKLLDESLRQNVINDTYNDYHNKTFDPILHVDIDIKHIYKYKYAWEPLNGEILGKDIRGPLIFDPDVLIHYFYTNRLKYLYIQGQDGYSGTYGEGLGNGPDFYNPSRGFNHHYYLFRIPLIDAYVDKNKMDSQITLTPKLDIKEIKKIYKLACKNKNNYKNLFDKERPNLLKIYELYHQAILKPNYQDNTFDKETIKQQFQIINMIAVDELKKM